MQYCFNYVKNSYFDNESFRRSSAESNARVFVYHTGMSLYADVVYGRMILSGRMLIGCLLKHRRGVVLFGSEV